jgi:hypothetical protein
MGCAWSCGSNVPVRLAVRAGLLKKKKHMNIVETAITIGVWALKIALVLVIIQGLVGIRYIPHRRVGIIEKLWSLGGSLDGGRILALGGEAGFRGDRSARGRPRGPGSNYARCPTACRLAAR